MESPTKTSKTAKDFTQATIRSIIYDSSIDDEDKKRRISELIKVIQDIHKLQLLKSNYEDQRDKSDQPNKELYDYIIDIIYKKQLELLIIQYQNAIINDPVNEELYDSRIRNIEAKLASGGRRKTKRRHTKRRKSKARRKNL